MADIVIKQIEEGMTGRQVADLLYSNFLALVGAIGSGGGGDIPTADIEKGVTAYGWGDHRQAGYLKGITAGMVTGALGYTPMDEAAWTKANIKATLGIADWALAASKPAYTTKEVAEDGNLYFTDARALAALAGVTDALAGDIGANATAIGVLQGYFTNGVAKSAAKLATSRKLWGQLFNGEADVTGALTGVTDITASGVLTIGKIKIGDGVIEWDAANGGFKVTGGLWATDYLSSKGVNTGASGGGGGGSSYQRLDTWDGYTSAKDGWVLSAKLGYGLKTTQDDILRQLADISGQGTNVTFTPALTSGTQIGTLTIDGEPVKMYAPSIPTDDINKGVTAYGWGNHANAGYAMASALSGYLPLSGGIVDGTIELRAALSTEDSWLYFSDKSSSERYAIGIRRPTNKYGLQYMMNGNYYFILHEGNYTDYTYSKSTIDGKFSGLGTFAYKSSLAFADLTDKPTTIGGYGITDALTALTSSADTNLSITVGGTTKSIANLYARYTERFRVVWNNPSEGTYDLNDLLGGYVRAYGSGGTLVNAPESFGHGAVLSLTNGTKALSGQLAWNVKHGNTTDVTKNLYWRVGDSANGYTYAKWHQIAFTDYTYSQSEIDTKLGGYLPLSGGTISSANGGALVIDRTSGGESYIKLLSGGVYKGSITVGNTEYGASVYNANCAKYLGIKDDGTPHYHGNTLIHSGNIGSQSVASAAKLTTARTIWGQSFDGTGNVSGAMSGVTTLTASGSATIGSTLYMTGTGSQIDASIVFSRPQNYIVMPTSGGFNVAVDTPTSANTIVRFASSKNVLIGTTTDSGYKLDVNGTLHASSAVSFDSTLNVTGQTTLSSIVEMGNAVRMVNSKYIYGRTNENVLHNILGINGSNVLLVNYGAVDRNVKAWLYGSEFRFSTYTDATALSGGVFAFIEGKLGVGTSAPGYKADIRGTIGVSDAITLRGTAAATANIAFSRSSYNYITFPTDGSLCLSTATSTSGIVLRVTTTAIEPMTTATKSVGTSSKRWGAIYGVDGDFSGTLHATTGIWSDGYVSAKGQNTSSDMRLKRVLEEVTLSVEDIAAAPAFRFEWKGGAGVDVGTSAQYWEKLVPDAVKRDDAGWRMMQYGNVAMVALISLARKVKELEEKLGIKN